MVEVGGARIGVDPRRRARRAGGWRACGGAFPDADAVVFGHSHLPLHERDGRLSDLQPRQPDRAPPGAGHTMGMAVVERGTVRFRHVEL